MEDPLKPRFWLRGPTERGPPNHSERELPIIPAALGDIAMSQTADVSPLAINNLRSTLTHFVDLRDLLELPNRTVPRLPGLTPRGARYLKSDAGLRVLDMWIHSFKRTFASIDELAFSEDPFALDEAIELSSEKDYIEVQAELAGAIDVLVSRLNRA